MNRKTRIISAALCAAALGAGTAQATVTYSGIDGGSWTDGANWGGTYPLTTDDTGLNTGSVISNEVPNDIRAIRLGYSGDGTLDIQPGAVFTATSHASWGSWLGMASGYSGTINQTGGSATYNELEVGSQVGATGYYNLSSGTATVVNALYDISLYVGMTKNAYKNGAVGGTGTFSMTGGTLLTQRGVQMGHPTIAGDGTFEVWGTGPETIGIGSNADGAAGSWAQYSNSTLRVGISVDGITPIVIDDANTSSNATALFAEGAVLDVSFMDGHSEVGSWTVMECVGTMVDGGMVFADSMGSTTNDWGFMVTNNNLMVGYGLGWPAGSATNIVLPPSPGRTLYWNGLAGDTDSSNGDNWQLDSTGTPATWGIYSEDSLFIGHYYAQDEGTNMVVDYDGTADFTGQSGLNVGWAREGTYNHNSGTLTFQTSSSSRQHIGGYNYKGKGTVNVNGGTLSYNTLRIGTDAADGTLNVNGGLLNIGRSADTFDSMSTSIVLGNNAASLADMTVSGGEVSTRGALVMGYYSASNSFSVIGSDAASIQFGKGGDNSIDGAWAQYAGTLNAYVDEGGLTTIEVLNANNSNAGLGKAYFGTNALLYVDWVDGVQNYGTFDVMTWDGPLVDEGLSFAPSVDTDIWSFEFVDTNADTTNDTLRITAYGETANGTSIPWLAEYGLTAEDDELDSDGDGHANYEEYRAGTNPTNSASVLAITSGEQISTDSFVITWQSVSNRTYMISTNTSLTAGTFGTLATGIDGEEGETSYTGSISGASAVFYEIGVE